MNIIQSLGQSAFRRRCILGTLLLGWLMRLALILRGGLFYNPDEYRYYRSIDFLHALVHGAWREALQVFYTYPQHNGSILVGAIPAFFQGLLDKVGLAPAQTMHFAAAILAVFPMLNALLGYGIMLRLNRSHAGAFLVLVVLTFSGTMTFYSRHLLPYYSSLTLALFVIWWMLNGKGGAWRYLIAGACSLGVFLIYNGFWYLSGALVGILALIRMPRLPSFFLRATLLAAGYLLGFAAVYGIGRTIDADFFRGLTYFSQTISQGDYADGWWIGWVHLFYAEGILLPLFALLALFSLRANRPSRLPLACVGLFYLLLLLGSIGLQKFVVYGRSMIPVYTVLVLAGVIGASRFWRDRPGAYVLLLALVLAQSLERYVGLFRQTFPSTILTRVQQTNPDLQLAYSVLGPQPHVDEAFMDPARFVLLNYRVLTPATGLASVPSGQTVDAWPHPASHPLYLYNGYTRDERVLLREADVRIRLIDTGALPD
ncbi:MAG: hypothetical protein ACI9TH_000507 [Kiritimatiellia bacterium]